MGLIMTETHIAKQISKVRDKIRKGPADVMLTQKPFAEGMYAFCMFMINYYAAVKEKLNLDYDSFMIIQTVVSSNLYLLNRQNGKLNTSYEDLESEWDIAKKHIEILKDEITNSSADKKRLKLSISSICLVTGLPKETVRRKVNELIKKNLLKISKGSGVLLGNSYKKVFQEFVPQTTLEVSKLLKKWNSTGVLKSLLKFNL